MKVAKPFLLVILLAVIPGIASANIGLPMLAVVWPLSLPSIIPVIVVEGWVVNRKLNTGWRHALIQMTKANVFSTLIGIPLTWAALVAIEFLLAFLFMNSSSTHAYPPHSLGQVGSIILTAPWLGPFTTGGHWILPVATIVLLVPFFFASFWAEAWYVAKVLCPEQPNKARSAIRDANLVSYLAIFVACVIWLGFGLICA